MRPTVTFLVLAFIGVVVAGLLIPATGMMRANADRVRCMDNLRRIGKYLTDEAMASKAYPAGTLQVAKLPPDLRLSWVVPGLGAMGHAELAAKIDLAAPWNAEVNRPVAGTLVPQLVCPAVTQVWSRDLGAPFNYPGMAGVGADAATKPANAPGAGIFRYDEPTFLTDIKDGRANTLMLLETAHAVGPWIAGGPPTVRPLVPETQPYLGQRRPFGGCHLRGANAAFADGSCRFLAESTTPRVLELLAGIADTAHSSDSQ
ncbi:MAG TPA: DUF1559 domain-containing protein [Gemmataceae bacterium]|jgi:prepilin-type processing-associated H-X9-DG protein|nr:DUF1559 domain-containing protein [Gemmataceae bacterium]